MSEKSSLAYAYHMGYDDALAKRKPDASKTEVLASGDLAAENAKLRELCETFGMIANDAICDYYDRDELLAQANVDARELGVEL